MDNVALLTFADGLTGAEHSVKVVAVGFDAQ
jgi:hypothetical protein